MIRFPLDSDVPRLQALWLECFPEDASGYCDFFFSRFFRPSRCLILANEQEAETACYWFPAVYQAPHGKGAYDFWYLYACGTGRRYRGKRNLRTLVDALRPIAISQGQTGFFLVAEESLIGMYDRWGMLRAGQLNAYSVARPLALSSARIAWTDCPLDRFLRLRERYLASLGPAFGWTREAGQWMYEDILTKGSVLRCQRNGVPYYAVVTREEDGPVIRETDFPLAQAEALLASVCRHIGHSGPVTFLTPRGRRPSLPWSPRSFYHGHYQIFCPFPGREALEGQVYINLTGD